jgi:hypothetical protein
MTIKKYFITGYNQSDVDFFTNYSNPGRCDYNLKNDILIDASQMFTRLSPYSYEPIKLKQGSIFDGCDRTITIYYSKKNDTNPFEGIFDILNGTVKNLNVKIIDNVILDDYCGWINTKHVICKGILLTIITNNCIIINCQTNGNISGKQNGGSGGITGAGTGGSGGSRGSGDNNYGSCVIENCITIGDIIPFNTDSNNTYGCGGIAGIFSGFGIN